MPAVGCGCSPLRAATRQPRDAARRDLYLREALADIPRLLGAIDRNPLRATHGCLDRQFWHYRTAAFPSEMYQEGALPLALVYRHELPGNRWRGQARVRELAIAAIRFAARRSHRDGSCDDYYPYERALGAAVFSLQAAARAYRLLHLCDIELLRWFERRARWVLRHGESGRLTNHHALAALGLYYAGQVTEQAELLEAAEAKVRQVLSWQSDEGWFEEYGGADPGYQTVTIDCLARYRRETQSAWLDAPLARAVAFARHFLHPDGSYGGEYGSRGTYHFYPHGFELLSGQLSDAADLADGYLAALAAGRQACFGDDRMYAHRTAGLIDAWRDWSPTRPEPAVAPDQLRYWPKAQILVRRGEATHTIVSAARGGVFKHFGHRGGPVTDSGLVLRTTDGRTAVSQMHDLSRKVEVALPESDVTTADPPRSGRLPRIQVAGSFHWSRFETATPPRQAALHLFMLVFGRHCRTLVRRLLQQRLITGRAAAPIQLERLFTFLPRGGPGPQLRVIDTIRLKGSRLQVRALAYASDHEAAYVAASGVYQEGVLQPWFDLGDYVERLNTHRRVTIVREFY